MLNYLVLFIRSFIFYVVYYFFTVALSLSFILVFPLLAERGRHVFASTWCGTILAWLRFSCGVRYEIIGRENIPDKPIVVLANHQSAWETILLYKLAYPVSPILKRELLNIPFWGWALRLQNPIAIDRSKPREAGKSLLTQGVDRITNGNSVIVFPEGTRIKAGSAKRFSRGGAKLAIAAGVELIPVAHNAGKCWPPRRFIKYPGDITVVIGDGLATEGRAASELTDEAENWIRQQMSEMD